MGSSGSEMADVFVTQVSKEEAAAFAPPEKTRPKLALQLEEEKPVYVQEDSDDDKSESDGPKVVKTLARQSSGEKPEKKEEDTPRSVGRTVAQSPRIKGHFVLPTLAPHEESHEEQAGSAAASEDVGSPKSKANKSIWQMITSCFQSDLQIDSSALAVAPEKAPAIVPVSSTPAAEVEQDSDEEEVVQPAPVPRTAAAFKISAASAAVPLGLLGENKTGKAYTLVLDLDETLVHSSFKPVPHSDFILSIEMDGIVHKVFVAKRPGVDEFLEEMAKHYELIIFTASLDKYANPLLDLLDPKKLITGRLFREHCTRQGQIYIKDLGRLGRPLSQTLIIDNSPHSFAMHPKYAIPILSWFDDPRDTELPEMTPFLEDLTKVSDVSSVLDASKPWRVCQRKLARSLAESR